MNEQRMETEMPQTAVNEMQIVFDSRSENEGFARMAVAAFISFLNPTVDELADIKTAVSEAVTNCIIHGYEMRSGKIFLECGICGRKITVAVTDEGEGISQEEQ